MIEYRSFRAMNTDILLGAEGDPILVQRGFDQASDYVHAMEARLTRFTDDSELSHLNRSGGEWFAASAELFEIVQIAREFHAETDGLFDPTVLVALENLGYDRSMDEIRVAGAPNHRGATVISHFDFKQVQLDSKNRRIRLEPGMRIDLGGIAKGWIAEKAALLLSQLASTCVVDAGGDLFAIGRPSDQGGWQVALEDPLDEEQTLAVLNVGPGAVATSSVTRRRWQQGTTERHHLIDPRRGLSAETDWLSVTVLAPHAAVAEVYAKVLLIAGAAGASRLAARRSDIEFIAVDRSRRLFGSPHVKEYLDVRN